MDKSLETAFPKKALLVAKPFGQSSFAVLVAALFGWVAPANAITIDVPSGPDLAGDYELTTGSDGLTKTGPGRLIIWNPQSYTGVTEISAGQIMIGGTGSISSQSALQVNSEASINLTGFYAPGDINRTFAGLTGAGIVYGGGGTVTINKASGTDTFSGDIQGPHGLIKDGAGTLVLSGSNNYTGGTLVSGGTLALHGGSVKGGITNNANVSITADLANVVSGTGSLTKTGAAEAYFWNAMTYTGATIVNEGQIILGGAGAISSMSEVQIASGAVVNLTGSYAANNINRTIGGLTGGGILYGGGGTVTVNKAAGTNTFSGDIQGPHGLIKDGAGTLVLTAANTYTGRTTISGGTLELNGGSVIGGITNNASLVIYNTLANAVSGTGSLAKNGSGTAYLWTANSYTGATIVNAGQIVLGGAGAISSESAVHVASGASINLTGDYALNNINRTVAGLTGEGVLYGGGGTVTVNKASGTDTFSGDIQGAQGLIKDGAGTLVLTSANTYTGGTTVSGGTLALHGGSVSGAIANNANVSITGDLANAVSGTGSLTKTGTAEAYLWTANSYTGATVVEAGTLTLGGIGAISESSALQINSGAAVNLTGMWAANNINRTVAGLTGAGVLYGSGGTVTVNTASGTDTFSGDIQGAHGLVKSGAGNLALSGASSYTGTTIVNEGRLVVAHGNALGGTTGGTIVASGAQLRINTLVDTVFAAEPLVISGDGVPSGGALRNATNNNTWKGNITLMANATIGAASGTTLTLDAASGASLNLEAYNLVVDGAGTVQVNGGIAGTGQISKTGSGQLVLSNSVLTATIQSNAVSVHFANPPGNGTFAVLSGPLDAGSLATANVTGLAAGQTATVANSPNLVIQVTELPAGPTFDSAYPGTSLTDVAPNGLTYLMNYAFGGSSSQAATLPNQDVNDPTKLTLVAFVRINNTVGTLSVVGEAGDALSNFDTVNPITGVVALDQSDAPAGTEKRIFSVPATGDRLFLRLKATLQP